MDNNGGWVGWWKREGAGEGQWLGWGGGKGKLYLNNNKIREKNLLAASKTDTQKREKTKSPIPGMKQGAALQLLKDQ